MYFTNVRFLQQLKQQTQKQSQLRHLLILASRILAITALVFAFAQPYIPYSKNESRKLSRNAVSVFVDNSFSMEAAGAEGSLLDEAKQKAKEIALAYKSSDLFQLLTSDFEGQHQRLVSRDEFITMLEEVKISPSVRSLSEIINRQYDLLKNEANSGKVSYLISDFQKTSYSLTGIKPDTSINTFLVPVKTVSVGNVFIDSCWFSQPTQQPGKTSLLTARIWNQSENDLEKIPLKLMINNQQKSVASVDIKAGMPVTVELPFTIKDAGSQQGELVVTDYPVTYDDKFYFSFDVLAQIKVLVINGNAENVFLNALFKQDSSVVLTNRNEKALDYSTLPEFDLIILNEIGSFSTGLSEEIKKYVTKGGTILVVPSPSSDILTYNSLLLSLRAPSYLNLDTNDTRVIKLSEESYLFKDVFQTQPGKSGINNNTDLPFVRKHFPILPQVSMLTHPLMSMLNGRHFLIITDCELGQVLQLTVPLDPVFSNFPQQALFVPVLYNIALISHPSHKLYSIIGDNKPISVNAIIPSGDKILKIKSSFNKQEFIPQVNRAGNQINLYLENQVQVAGNYFLTDENAVLTTLAFNYNRGESDLRYYTPDEMEVLLNKSHLGSFKVLNAKQKPLNEVISQVNNGTQLWYYFIWVALVFLLVEVLLIRFFKK